MADDAREQRLTERLIRKAEQYLDKQRGTWDTKEAAEAVVACDLEVDEAFKHIDQKSSPVTLESFKRAVRRLKQAPAEQHGHDDDGDDGDDGDDDDERDGRGRPPYLNPHYIQILLVLLTALATVLGSVSTFEARKYATALHDLQQNDNLTAFDAVDAVNSKDFDPENLVSPRWMSDFMKEHPEIKSGQTAVKENARHNAECDLFGINCFFRRMERVRDELQIPDENVFNLDETGISLDHHVKYGHRTITVEGKPSYVRSADLPYTTLISCINNRGEGPRGLLIHKNKVAAVPKTCKHKDEVLHDISDNGWAKSDNFATFCQEFADYCEKLREQRVAAFEPGSEERKREENKFFLLVMDGCGIHATLEALQILRAARIVPILLPPHLSHILQPLDLTVFGSFKSRLKTLLLKLVSDCGLDLPNEGEIIEVILQALAESKNEKNCESGFRSGGIVPVDHVHGTRKLTGGLADDYLKKTWNNACAQVATEELFDSIEDGEMDNTALVSLKSFLADVDSYTSSVDVLAAPREQEEGAVDGEEEEEPDLSAGVPLQRPRDEEQRFLEDLRAMRQRTWDHITMLSNALESRELLLPSAVGIRSAVARALTEARARMVILKREQRQMRQELKQAIKQQEQDEDSQSDHLIADGIDRSEDLGGRIAQLREELEQVEDELERLEKDCTAMNAELADEAIQQLQENADLLPHIDAQIREVEQEAIAALLNGQVQKPAAAAGLEPETRHQPPAEIFQECVEQAKKPDGENAVDRFERVVAAQEQWGEEGADAVKNEGPFRLRASIKFFESDVKGAGKFSIRQSGSGYARPNEIDAICPANMQEFAQTLLGMCLRGGFRPGRSQTARRSGIVPKPGQPLTTTASQQGVKEKARDKQAAQAKKSSKQSAEFNLRVMMRDSGQLTVDNFNTARITHPLMNGFIQSHPACQVSQDLKAAPKIAALCSWADAAIKAAMQAGAGPAGAAVNAAAGAGAGAGAAAQAAVAVVQPPPVAALPMEPQAGQAEAVVDAAAGAAAAPPVVGAGQQHPPPAGAAAPAGNDTMAQLVQMFSQQQQYQLQQQQTLAALMAEVAELKRSRSNASSDGDEDDDSGESPSKRPRR